MTEQCRYDVDWFAGTATTMSTTTTTMMTTTTSTTTMTTSVPDCIIENNIDYPGNDINNGDPQNDAESCRSFCQSNYPTAKYFSLGTGNACRCKTSNSGRIVKQGVVSGNVMCTGKFGATSMKFTIIA